MVAPDYELPALWVQSSVLPRLVPSVRTPPIKSQGIKTKLVNFIARSLHWEGQGRWIEPFAGSGVVAFNVGPPRVLLADTNPHVIRLYRDISSGQLGPARVRAFLETEGERLLHGGADVYYEIRDRFNESGDPLDFLFLNRSCFNGLIRFSKSGRFNVPFGHKPARFSRAYITRIVNQVAWVQAVMKTGQWTIAHQDWRETVAKASRDDFIYADPPYSGRFADFYSRWADTDLELLLSQLKAGPAPFAISTWVENRFRRNPYLDFDDPEVDVRTTKHFYHLGASEGNRHEMTEALIIRKGSASKWPDRH
jgi:DNA adenine methylase